MLTPIYCMCYLRNLRDRKENIMAKWHYTTLKEGTKSYKAAMQTLTVEGHAKKGYTRFSDLGLPGLWKLYLQRKAKK